MPLPSFAARLIASASAALSRGDDDLEALEGLDAAMVVVDATTAELPLVYVNRSFRDLTGYTNDEIIGRNCRFLQGEETDPRDRAKFREGLEAGKPFQITIVNHRKDGSTFRNRVFVSPVRDGGSDVTHFIGILVPVEDEEQGNKIAELRHRMKNHIQSLTSLVSLQSRRVEGEEGRRALEDLRARVDTLGAIFVEFEMGGSEIVALDPFVKLLVKRLSQGYDPAESHRIVFDLAPIAMQRSRAAIVGQIVTELIINVYRHAFVGQTAGTIRISLRRDGDQVELAVADNGNGLGEKPKTRTLGLAIVNNLARSLDGTFEPMSSAGFVARLSFPLDAPRA